MHVFAVLLGIWLLVLGVFRIILAIADRSEAGASRWGWPSWACWRC